MRTSSKYVKQHLSLSLKLTLGVVFVVLLALSVMGSAFYYFESHRLEKDAEDRIEQAVHGLNQMLSQSISHMIRAQLQTAADGNLDVVRMYYQKYRQGLLTEKAAKQAAEEVLLSHKIGRSGYLYVVDSSGTLRVHPKQDLVNVNISKHAFIQEQIRRKSGYLEYEWKNPGEDAPRKKALAMSYFKPWDYIISASAYRKEFTSLVDLNSFKDDVLNIKFGRTGYAYILDTKGNVLIHPQLEGTNIYDSKDAGGRKFIAEMCRKKNGKISYPWKNPGEKVARKKDVIFRYFSDLDIIVAGGIYQEELYEPLASLRKTLLLILAGVLLLSIPAVFIAARAFGRPLIRLSGMAQKIADKDLRVVQEFHEMAAEEDRRDGYLRRATAEIMALLRAFKGVGLSIKELIELLVSNAKKLHSQQSVIESAATFSNSIVSEQSTMVSQVSKTVAELQEAFLETEQVTLKMKKVAKDAVEHVTHGQSAVKQAQSAMTAIGDRCDDARAQINRLTEITGQIEEMVSLVSGIATHSQLLAINASIQAAKAGQAGLGFSVVASEVRALSKQSAQSTKHIRESLVQIKAASKTAIQSNDESCAAVDKGKLSVQKLSSVVKTLNDIIQLNNETADGISTIITFQSDAIDQIHKAVEQVERRSLEGTKTAEGLLQAVEALRLTQTELFGLVSQYRV